MAAGSDAPPLRVAVALVMPGVQELVALQVPRGTTVAEAVAQSGLVERYRLDPQTLQFAVFGERRRADATLIDGDRIELLRPLRVDPKEARRARAKRR